MRQLGANPSPIITYKFFQRTENSWRDLPLDRALTGKGNFILMKKFNVNSSQTIPLLLLVLLTYLAGLSTAKAISPAPDGGYPGGNTAEGQNALFSLTTGGYNTAVGWMSLR